jgi:hypothetical protein
MISVFHIRRYFAVVVCLLRTGLSVYSMQRFNDFCIHLGKWWTKTNSALQNVLELLIVLLFLFHLSLTLYGTQWFISVFTLALFPITSCEGCFDNILLYEGSSEMFGTHLEYKLRDEDSHIITLQHTPRMPHWSHCTAAIFLVISWWMGRTDQTRQWKSSC